MSLTAAALLQEFADFSDLIWNVSAGTAGNDLEELRRRKAVGQLNTALRWAWKEHDPLFAWPWTLDTGTVTVTDGKILASALGEGSWCSLWTVDPRPLSSDPQPLTTLPGIDGSAHILEELGQNVSTCFAFFRTATPQLTYGSTSTYTTPVIPDQLRHPIILYAMGIRMSSVIKNDERNNFIQQATDWVDQRMQSIGESKPLWMRNACAL